MPRHHALRRGRRSIPGQTYLLTSACLNRVPHFATFEAASAVCRVFADRVAWAGSTPLAWVVMPDHWHALVEMGNGAPLHVLVRGINSHAARAANAARGTSGQVFYGAFHDRALRTEADIHRCVRYIIQNPVCAGLARSFREYPFWDAAWLRR